MPRSTSRLRGSDGRYASVRHGSPRSARRSPRLQAICGNLRALPAATVHNVPCRAIAGYRIYTRRGRLPALRSRPPAAGVAPGPDYRQPEPTTRSCPGSLPVLRLNLLELLFDDAVDPRGFLPQVAQLAERLHPRLVLGFPGGQLLLKRRRYQRPQRNPDRKSTRLNSSHLG